MKIDLKASQFPWYPPLFIGIGGFGSLFVCLLIVFFLVPSEIPVWAVITVGVVAAIFLLVFLLFKFGNSAHFVFDEKEIAVYNGGKLTKKFNVEDIEKMYYYSLNSLFAGEHKGEGGCWKLHLKMKNGTREELSFIKLKDVKVLKEKLYNDLTIC